jgi:hypothetical protein
MEHACGETDSERFPLAVALSYVSIDRCPNRISKTSDGDGRWLLLLSVFLILPLFLFRVRLERGKNSRSYIFTCEIELFPVKFL